MWAFPAYGRKYATRLEALKDWKDGKDFKDANGYYFSIRDADLLRRKYHSLYVVLDVETSNIVAFPI